MKTGILIVCIICALIGGMIGQIKSRTIEEFFAGLLLGPLGVVWIIARTAKYRCPKCRRTVERITTRCNYCDFDIIGINNKDDD